MRQGPKVRPVKVARDVVRSLWFSYLLPRYVRRLQRQGVSIEGPESFWEVFEPTIVKGKLVDPDGGPDGLDTAALVGDPKGVYELLRAAFEHRAWPEAEVRVEVTRHSITLSEDGVSEEVVADPEVVLRDRADFDFLRRELRRGGAS